MFATIYFFDAALSIFLVYLARKVLVSRRKLSHPYPPGPRPWPLIGNLFDIPKVPDPWNAFTELGHKYGPLIHFNVLGQHIVVVNSFAHASEMLDRAIYSDRPPLVMAAELSGYEDTLPLMPYGSRFRATRRLVHRFMGTRALVTKYGSQIEEEEARRVMRRILEDPSPESLHDHLRKFAGAVILRMTYAYTPREHHDPLVQLAEDTLAQFSIVSQAGVFLVDTIPALRHLPSWMPGAGFLRLARDAKDNICALAQRPMDYQQSFISENVSLPISDEDEYMLKWTAVNMYAGGADTSVSALYAAILALVMHPDVQRKAQEEVDRVIGSERLPTLADRDNLPYIDAMTKEIFRWSPTVPTAIPHRLTEDDIYNGFFLPKDTIVIPNIQNMLYDPEVYPEPRRFIPERFLQREGKDMEPNPYPAAFGFGRRVCPGIQLADTSAFMIFATAAAVLSISKVIENGAVVEPLHRTVGGTIVHPAGFKCKIIPRSSAAAALVMGAQFNE
ncbi:cytochrome P450 [Vararia minispora EC-137]|uniref:Cytochrome P450 n=1 Tax=Vararia minispora EC-137 TaxID=1314806 RepID=A0ACB8Q779_9AGAM|nr:cytochrome P450 [Vararia minispora EC-137]